MFKQIDVAGFEGGELENLCQNGEGGGKRAVKAFSAEDGAIRLGLNIQADAVLAAGF